MHHNEPRYFLAKHAHMCVAQGYAVFLDVKKDKYSALSGGEALAVKEAIAGWPAITVPPDVPVPDSQTDSEKLLQELRDEGLITNESLAGKHASPVRLDEATSDFRSLMLGTSSVPILQTVHFVAAWAQITLALQTRSLEYSIERVRRRKAPDWQSDLPLDPDELRPLIASYFELQPRFFSSHNTCLRNSLTLIEYLARHGAYPTWVFGVHMEPWAAHSWVQSGAVVLNDTVDHVRDFTPILTI